MLICDWICFFNFRYIYWTESGTTPRVRRTSIANPSSIEDIYTSAGDPTGIAIDYLSDVLIWSDLVDNTIRSSNFNGTNVIDIITTTSDQAPFQIVVTGDKLYWTSPDSAGINRITLFNPNTLVHFSLEGYPVASSTNGITVIDENKRPGMSTFYHLSLSLSNFLIHFLNSLSLSLLSLFLSPSLDLLSLSFSHSLTFLFSLHYRPLFSQPMSNECCM